ncbi:AMP-binding protein [Nocardia xishanensis]|uniref:AMP-binding protein n=1 Tax=Nocardia xishanensis TaxID=238964 RepID=UPI00341AEFA2
MTDAAAAAGITHLTLTPDAHTGVPPIVEVADRDPHETAAVLYTSGNTGRPKGAELSVANLLAAGEVAWSISCAATS